MKDKNNFLDYEQDWQPPFAVDVDKFRFVPRVQRLNELEVRDFASTCSCVSYLLYIVHLINFFFQAKYQVYI